MKNIYQRASLVLIILGEKFNNSVGTFVCNLVCTICRLPECWAELFAYHHFPEDQMLYLLNVPPRADKSWSTLKITMKLLYFERVWVIWKS